MEIGSRNIIPSDGSKRQSNIYSMKRRVNSHKQLPALRIPKGAGDASSKNAAEGEVGTTAGGQEEQEFTNFIQDSGLHQQEGGLGGTGVFQGTKSFADMAAPSASKYNNMMNMIMGGDGDGDDDDINVDEDEELQAMAKQQKDEAMTKHFENIENNVN